MPSKKMVKIFNKIRNIIIGTANNILGLKKEISNPRMEICNRCEYAKDIFKLGKICSKCGCILKSKTTVENEHCELNKW